MNTKWPTVRLGEVLHRVKNDIRIVDGQTYSRLTIRMNGKGIAIRDRVLGHEIGTKRQFLAKAGQLVLSKIDARNGAFGILTQEGDNAIITGNFWAFDIHDKYLHSAYFGYLTRTPMFVDFCVRASEGSTNRRYLQEDTFLRQELHLPSLLEQQRIVARIEELEAQIQEAHNLRQQAGEEVNNLFLRSRADKFASLTTRFPLRQLGELVSMSSGEGLTSAQMDESAPYPVYGGGGLAGRYSRYLFEEPKVVIGRVGARCGCVFVTQLKSWVTDNAICITEISEDLYLPYLVHALISLEIRQQANQAAQPVVSQKKINPLLIPVPPPDEQHRIVVELDTLQTQVDTLKHLQAETAAELDALLPSILDRAFKGEL